MFISFLTPVWYFTIRRIVKKLPHVGIDLRIGSPLGGRTIGRFSEIVPGPNIKMWRVSYATPREKI